MDYGRIDHFQTGVAVPVFSLRSRHGVGSGEFLDLLELGAWCRDCRLDLIQVLPVNDTGSDPSPYGAISAFALHPVYARLTAIPGAEAFASEIDEARRRFAGGPRLDYAAVLAFKLDLLRRIFTRRGPDTVQREIAPWLQDHAWVKTYAVYRELKDEAGERPWWEWTRMQRPSPTTIEREWEARPQSVLFHAWIQHELDRQLGEAAAGLHSHGIRLEGDLPILLREDSVDVWAHPEYFDRGGRAGAPPDMFSTEGQNWGFPCYQWSKLEESDYAWWRQRLRHASRHYHAVRLDHVLGFFRIWRIPADATTGMLGQFDPAVPIRSAELRACGFSDEQIRAASGNGGDDGGTVPSEAEALAIPDQARRQAQLEEIWNRLLLRVPGQEDAYRPLWHYRKTRRYAELPGDLRAAFDRLVAEDDARQQTLWADTGRARLRMLLDSSDMRLIGEDLGAVPPCVPEVLEQLGICGLRIERWTRRWHEEGMPFIAPSDYERLTVCSPSAHDTPTVRGWWQENEPDRRAYAPLIGIHGEPPERLDSELYARVLERNLAANSLFCVFLAQDLLSLSEGLAADDPRQDRINVPGTRSATNWTYRMPLDLDELRGREDLTATITRLVEQRRARPLT